MIDRNVTVFLGSTPRATKIFVSQFDTMWRFVFTVIHNSQAWQIPTGATAVLNGKKPDGNVFAFSGTVTGNKVTVDCDVQMTAVAGPVLCELSILSGGKVVGTANFVLNVEAAPKSPDDVSSDSTLPAYAELLEAFSGDIENAVDRWLNAHSSQIGGLTDAAKRALLALLEKVAFANEENGREYLDALEDALYPPAPPASLVSISAVFTQGSTVIYDTATLDDLKPMLTVTATYDDSTTEPVTNYTLSGTLAEGTSTITVSYGGKTATFSVTVSHDAGGPVEMSAFMQHNVIRDSGFGHYSDGGNTPYSDARFPTTNGWTAVSDVFDNDANIKVTFTPSASAFQCWLFGSTNFDNSFSLNTGNGGDYWLKYITPSSDVFAYGWSTAPHTFTASVKAGCRFMIMGISSSSHDISEFSVEVV